MKDNQTTVKFLTRGIKRNGVTSHWSRQLPGSTGVWGRCRFTFDLDEEQYDWLVVYHDLPRDPIKGNIEKLSCPKEKTILITTEPSSITVYGSGYLEQFGLVITSQEPWAVRHHNALFTQPGLIWFYGISFDDNKVLTFDDLKNMAMPEKSRSLSTVCSARQGRLTVHHKRFQFTEKLKERLPELEIFGHGVNPMADKAEALDAFKYHVTVENHVFQHHLTEKLPDAFLGYTLPFYHGCPNAADYFNPESFIPIDINNFARTVDIIRSTIANNEFEDRLPYIKESRKKVLEEYNLFSLLEREITKRDPSMRAGGPGGIILGRSALKRRKPLQALRREFEKIYIKMKHL